MVHFNATVFILIYFLLYFNQLLVFCFILNIKLKLLSTTQIIFNEDVKKIPLQIFCKEKFLQNFLRLVHRL